ncbi:LacI family DNA-binding transcriptional regulator [Thalassobacillus sp. CUG 92003]|uniref:LacI family DNA-binding transcriptional regulator n=1 Tax=Thalassobacillus sp. CUG 92003 TaxID=2736641 RepID=UPI0015E76EB9|nr:substrate-binding domain-containing protein [Thalassobacillus sp. CUG 92003]
MTNKKITIREVATQAGVSISTVSQYMNKRFDYMGTETRKRIESAIRELDYQPNVVARSLKVKNTRTIGIVVANILHNFSTEVIRAIEDECHNQGFSTIICNADDEPEKERKYLNTLLSKQVDGLILFPTGGNIEIHQKLADESFPMVFIDRIIKEMTVDSVLLDNHRAIDVAVEHLIENGYERIAILTSSLLQNVTPRIERIEGFQMAMKNRGLPMHPEYVKGMEIKDLNRGLKRLYSLKQPPDAFIAGNDLTLMEILKFASEEGKQIGREMGLVTIDEVDFAKVYAPPLSTIAQPTFEMGRQAASLLLNKVRGDVAEPPRIHRYAPQLNARASSRKH